MTTDPVHRTWIHSDRFVPSRFIRPLQQFTQIEAASGIVLLAAALAALLLANSPWSDGYFNLLATPVVVELGPLSLRQDLLHLINDGLMAIFFYVVSLEIKREMVSGELSSPRTAALPVVAALGSMVGPALIYAVVAGSTAPGGWGVPMPTDIAFSLGVLALLGTRIPTVAKLFLLGLAIADDIGTIAVIAVFYAGNLHLGWFSLSVTGLGAAAFGSRIGVRWIGYYVIIGFGAWLAMLESGINGTLTGVALAFLTPTRPMYGSVELDVKARAIMDTFPVDSGPEMAGYEALQLAQIAKESASPLSRMEAALHTWSSFGIIPVFAFANAGISFSDLDLGSAVASRVTLGVASGLLIGNIIGVWVFTRLAVRLGWAALPSVITNRHLLGLSTLAGIGFTVSLFVTNLAFSNGEHIAQAKLGIFGGSFLSGLLGYLILRKAPVAGGDPT